MTQVRSDRDCQGSGTRCAELGTDTVAARLAELRRWQDKLQAMQDRRLNVDDAERFERTSVIIEANMLIARHRLENAPPENQGGVSLLLRYGLSVTNDPCLAAIIKSCLVTLLDMAPPPDAVDAEEIPDEAFDDAVNWPDLARAPDHAGTPAR